MKPERRQDRDRITSFWHRGLVSWLFGLWSWVYILGLYVPGLKPYASLGGEYGVGLGAGSGELRAEGGGVGRENVKKTSLAAIAKSLEKTACV
jgi:hypothetical protein